jgi:large subunit ribosomal protein L15
MRGFSNFNFRRNYAAVTLQQILPLVAAGFDKIDLALLLQKEIVRVGTREIKIIGNAALPSAVFIHAHAFSVGAAEAIRRAGGQAILVAVTEAPGGAAVDL